MATENEKDRLYRKVRTSLAGSVREVELSDNDLNDIFEIVVEDYAERVQSWLLENHWGNLENKDLTKTDIAFALSTRSQDYENAFSYSYSKIVGLQSIGPWELKKDFIELEAGKQVYQVPAGREINEVLWITPSSIDRALFANYGGGMDLGGFSAGGYGQIGNGGGVNNTAYGSGKAGYYVAPAFDVLLTAADMTEKNRMLRSDLTYKVTAGPNGTKFIHLFSVPGSKLSFGGAGNLGGVGSSVGLVGHYVWYHYYDTDSSTVDACRKDNPDIVRLPNEVPLDRLNYTDFNEPTKVIIRQLMVAKAKQIVGITRGKYTGAIGVPMSERKMDYEMFLSQAKEEYDAAMLRLDERLVRLSTQAQLTKKADEAQQLNNILKFRPLPHWKMN